MTAAVGPPNPALIEAVAARVTAAAYEVVDEPARPGRRHIVHCLSGGWLGADWDLARVLRAVESAAGLYWAPASGWAARHDLTVITPDGRLLQFDVPAPAPGVGV